MSGKTNFRRIIYILHLWVGIPCAIFLFIMCLSGTAYVFNKEITRWLDKEKFTLPPHAGHPLLPVSQLIAGIEKEKTGFRVTSIQIPQKPDESWLFGLLPSKINANAKISPNKKNSSDPNTKEKKPKPKIFCVNPYTGQVLGDAQTPASQTFATILQLHRWLLIDNHDIGAAITGSVAMLMVLLQLTGLMLWLPARLRQWKKWPVWKQGLKVNFRASAKRVNFDLHKTLGFYTFTIVTIMALTGPIFGFEWYRNGFNKMLGAKPVNKKETDSLRSNTSDPIAAALPFETIAAITDSIYPYKGSTIVTLPQNNKGVVSIVKSHEGFLASAGADRIVLDQYSGAIIRLDPFSAKTTGQKISSIAKAIHTGEVFGTFSRILYFIACLLATSLPVTGVIIWWGRRSKKKSTAPIRQRLSVAS